MNVERRAPPVRPFLRRLSPAPAVRVRFLHTVAACTDLAAVTLAARWGVSPGGDWAASAAAALPAAARRDLAVLDVYFGHGFCLRDAALVLWGADHPAMADFARFVREVEGAAPTRWAVLVGLALALRLDAHGLAAPDETTAARLGDDPAARRTALARLLEAGDRVEDGALRAELLALAADLPGLRQRVAAALRAFGERSLAPAADGSWSGLRACARRWAGSAPPPDPLAAFPLVTGRVPPPEDRAALAEAREVLFFCCAHLGEQCSLGQWQGRFFVCFEPAVAAPAPWARADAEAAAPGSLPAAEEAAFAALAIPGRRAIIALLAAGREMYAQELVRAAALPQATAATHLAELEGAGLVASERRGHRRYYALVPGAGQRLAAEVLRLFGG